VTAHDDQVPLARVAGSWLRLGITGFGGPPAHIALLRRLVVERERWIAPEDFEDAIAACNLLPGPASTQMAIFCGYRAAGWGGAIVGGLGFILPAVVMVLALAALFLGHSPPLWVRGAGAGTGAAVAAVALRVGLDLAGSSRARTDRADRRRQLRWWLYLLAGGAAADLTASLLVLVLLACGLVELLVRRRPAVVGAMAPFLAAARGGLDALSWTALKVGALSFGGGFVIVPLMHGDAVHTYHWMSDSHFLNAVAIGQVTPGPVVATVAAVGYAAHGLGGGILAAAVAFAPSFTFVLLGGRRFARLRTDARARAFLDGAGPAAVGAIAGASIPLALALAHAWQAGVLAAAAVALLLLRRGVVETLVLAGLAGAFAGVAGAPV
jgi:chromate transporter